MFHEETKQGKLTDFFLIFGRVTLFYYFLHMVVIHVFAIIGILIFGGNWQDMIITAEGFTSQKLMTYGYSLFVVYLVWIGVVLLFMLKYYDWSRLDELRKADTAANVLDVINNYRQSDRDIKRNILNIASLDRSEAANLVLFYKQMLVSS